MNPCELLQTMMDDGAWDGKPPVDIGGGFAVSPGDDGIAVFGDYFGGMVAVPWDVVRKLADYLPNVTHEPLPKADNRKDGSNDCKV